MRSEDSAPNTGLPASPDEIRGADRVLLPGVGEASSAMQKLRERSLVEVSARSPNPCWASVSACSCFAKAAKRAIPPASASSTTAYANSTRCSLKRESSSRTHRHRSPSLRCRLLFRSAGRRPCRCHHTSPGRPAENSAHGLEQRSRISVQDFSPASTRALTSTTYTPLRRR